MSRRLLALVVAPLAVAAVMFAAAAPASAAPAAAAAPAATPNASVVPITGSAANGSLFNGTLDITSVTRQGGVLQAVGTLTGTLTSPTGAVLGTVNALPVTLPLAATGTCQVLHLELGPLDLNLLGLRVQLNRVVLDITAQSGPGNLLGNLLCAVAGLLDNNGPLAGITGLLNNILRNV